MLHIILTLNFLIVAMPTITGLEWSYVKIQDHNDFMWFLIADSFINNVYCHGCGSEMIRVRVNMVRAENETLASRLTAPEPWTSRDVT